MTIDISPDRSPPATIAPASIRIPTDDHHGVTFSGVGRVFTRPATAPLVVLRDVTLAVRPGEVVALLGASQHRRLRPGAGGVGHARSHRDV
ncbi:MAG: hypothetical protein ACSLFN_12605 [Candidatus Limnocylindrales bacterium]